MKGWGEEGFKRNYSSRGNICWMGGLVSLALKSELTGMMVQSILRGTGKQMAE